MTRSSFEHRYEAHPDREFVASVRKYALIRVAREMIDLLQESIELRDIKLREELEARVGELEPT
jgi:hypothetical protein